MRLFNERQILLMRRESRVVLGRKAVGLWLLAMVLTATFLSIAFSKGSTSYLDEKMNDPFTNWVNINLREIENGKVGDDKIFMLEEALDEDTLQLHYGFDGWQSVNWCSMDMVGNNNHSDAYSSLSYEHLSNDLIAKVLSGDNVIQRYCIDGDSIDSLSMGVIATLGTIEKLGYNENNVPAFVNYNSNSEGADSLGVDLYDGKYARAPLPLLAVVKRLPMNKQVIVSKYLYKQAVGEGDDYPLCLNNNDYVRDLNFFVPEEIPDFSTEKISSILPDSLRKFFDEVLMSAESTQKKLKSWQKGHIWNVYFTQTVIPPLSVVRKIEECIMRHYASQGIVRVYDYKPVSDKAYRRTMGENVREIMDDDIISIHFVRLDSIRAFEHYVRGAYGLQIEMTQVNAKENFSSVSNMASILTLALIVFSIIAIVLFVVNMLQSYFQKVKRNLGTFKAFGISTKELVMVYVTVVVGIVIMALAIALAVTWLVELLLPCFGLTKEGGAPHLILWNSRTLWAIAIILLCAVSSVLVVLRRLLRQTPGNLIYDR